MGCANGKACVPQQAVESNKTLLASTPHNTDDGQSKHQVTATTALVDSADDVQASPPPPEQNVDEQTTTGASGATPPADTTGGGQQEDDGSTSLQHQVEEKLRNVKLIIEGVVEGFAGAELPNFEELTTDVNSIYDKLDSAFQHLQGKSIFDIGQAFVDAAEAMTPVMHFMKSIDSLKAEAERLEKALTRMKSPTRVLFFAGKTLEVNHKELHGLIENAVQYRQASDWKQYGKTIGMIIAEFVPEGDESESEPEEIDEFSPTDDPGMADPQKLQAIVDGLLDGFFGTIAPDVTESVEALTGVITRLVATMKNLEKKTLVSTGKALEELALGLESLQKVLQSAGAAREELDKFGLVISQIKGPETFVVDVAKNAGASLILNGKDILGDVDAAAKAFKAERWEDFGRDLGKAVGVLAKPVSKPVPWPFSKCCMHANLA